MTHVLDLKSPESSKAYDDVAADNSPTDPLNDVYMAHYTYWKNTLGHLGQKDEKSKGVMPRLVTTAALLAISILLTSKKVRDFAANTKLFSKQGG